MCVNVYGLSIALLSCSLLLGIFQHIPTATMQSLRKHGTDSLRTLAEPTAEELLGDCIISAAQGPQLSLVGGLIDIVLSCFIMFFFSDMWIGWLSECN